MPSMFVDESPFAVRTRRQPLESAAKAAQSSQNKDDSRYALSYNTRHGSPLTVVFVLTFFYGRELRLVCLRFMVQILLRSGEMKQPDKTVSNASAYVFKLRCTSNVVCETGLPFHSS